MSKPKSETLWMAWSYLGFFCTHVWGFTKQGCEKHADFQARGMRAIKVRVVPVKKAVKRKVKR